MMPWVWLARDAGPKDPLVEELTRKGMDVCVSSLIHSVDRLLSEDEEKILALWAEFSWVVVTSARALQALEHQVPISLWPQIKWACVGPATSEKLHSFGMTANWSQKRGGTMAMAEPFISQVLKGERILLALGSLAGTDLQNALTHHGLLWQRVNLYDTLAVSQQNPQVLEHLKRSKHGVVLFYSPSAVAAYQHLYEEICPLRELKSVAIGETTAASLRACGCQKFVVAKEPTPKGMLEALGL